MKTSAALCILLLAATSAAAETLHGEACYHFAQGESLRAARDRATALAERNALEAYSVFTDALGAVQDPALRDAFVLGLMPSLLRNLQVTSELLRPGQRQVCHTITAQAEPRETIRRVVAKMNSPDVTRLTTYPWFPENDLARVMEAIPFDRADQKRIVFLFRCKRREDAYLDTANKVQRERFHIVLSWIDHRGLPGASAIGSGDCPARDAIGSIELPLPPWDFRYWIELPNTAANFASWDVR